MKYRVLRDTDGTFMFVEATYDDDGKLTGLKDSVSLKSKNLQDLEIQLENIAEALNYPAIYMEEQGVNNV